MASTAGRAPRSVDEYMRTVPPALRPALKRLRQAVREAAPDAEEGISYGMPAYRQDGVLLYFAAFKEHCSLFPASTSVRRTFAKELRRYAGGKGTIRFGPDRPLPAALVRRIVRARLKENAARRARRGR